MRRRNLRKKTSGGHRTRCGNMGIQLWQDVGQGKLVLVEVGEVSTNQVP